MPKAQSADGVCRAPETGPIGEGGSVVKERLRKFIDIKPVVVDGEPDAHNVFLHVTNQRFCLTPYAETKDDAEWMADMLAVALERIVTQMTEKA